MQNPFLGQVLAVGFNFAPSGWAFCNGQLLPITQNAALFSLLGTSFGGDGRSTFALPNLQSRVPLCFGQGVGLTDFDLGEEVGEESVTVTSATLPAHSHGAVGFALRGNSITPTSGATWARSQTGDTPYAASSNGSMSPVAVGMTGGNLPHENRQPFLVVNFVIALQGIFPSRS